MAKLYLLYLQDKKDPTYKCYKLGVWAETDNVTDRMDRFDENRNRPLSSQFELIGYVAYEVKNAYQVEQEIGRLVSDVWKWKKTGVKGIQNKKYYPGTMISGVTEIREGNKEEVLTIMKYIKEVGGEKI